MISLGLSESERVAFNGALKHSHRMRVVVTLHNSNEKPVASIEARVLSGSVQVDATSDVTRSLELSLLDPDNKLRFEPNSAGLAVFADTFVSVERGIYVEAIERWIDVPVFWGPVTQFKRQGAQVDIEGQGKESLMLEPHLAVQGYTIRKRTRLDDAVRQVASRAGESRFSLPDLSQRLNRGRVVEPEAEPWKVLRGGEEDTHYQMSRKQKKRARKGGKDPKPPGGLVGAFEGYDCFYDGTGRLNVRRVNRNSVFAFTEEMLLTKPDVTYDVAEFRNLVIVNGGKAKGARRAGRSKQQLPVNNPLSPQSLGRNGKPRFMVDFIDADSLKTDRACRRRAQQELTSRSKEGVTAEFESLPVPHLEENDSVTVRSRDATFTFPVRQFTIPLVHSTAMTIGTLGKVAA